MILPLSDEKAAPEMRAADEPQGVNPPPYDALSFAHSAPSSPTSDIQIDYPEELTSPADGYDSDSSPASHHPYPNPESDLNPSSASTPPPPRTLSGHAAERKKNKDGHKVASAVSTGMLALVVPPVAVASAALATSSALVQQSARMVEGIGRGLVAGPEAAYRAYGKAKLERDARIACERPDGRES